MQKYREISADLAEPLLEHVGGCRTYDDPVALADRPAQQSVSNGAANEIGLHGTMLMHASPSGTRSSGHEDHALLRRRIFFIGLDVRRRTGRGLDHLVVCHRLEVNGEAPQPVHVPQHLVFVQVERAPVVPRVPKSQTTVALNELRDETP